MSKKSKSPLRFGLHRPTKDEDFMSFRLRGINLYLLLCLIAFIILLSSYALVHYTSFNTWVGASTNIPDEDVQMFSNRLNDLQNRIEAQNAYILTLKQRKTGETFQDTTELPSVDTNESRYGKRISLDDSLRVRLQRNNITTPVRTPFILNLPEDGNFEDQFLIPPIRGSVRKKFSLTDRHFGVDIIAPKNSAVKCTLEGLVLESDWTLEGGNTIIVQHVSNLISVYKHNSALLKKKGDRVRTGEAIAIIGNTGLHSAGPHVHFELWHQGEPLDPEAYIQLESKE